MDPTDFSGPAAGLKLPNEYSDRIQVLIALLLGVICFIIPGLLHITYLYLGAIGGLLIVSGVYALFSIYHQIHAAWQGKAYRFAPLMSGYNGGPYRTSYFVVHVRTTDGREVKFSVYSFKLAKHYVKIGHLVKYPGKRWPVPMPEPTSSLPNTTSAIS